MESLLGACCDFHLTDDVLMPTEPAVGSEQRHKLLGGEGLGRNVQPPHGILDNEGPAERMLPTVGCKVATREISPRQKSRLYSHTTGSEIVLEMELEQGRTA